MSWGSGGIDLVLVFSLIKMGSLHDVVRTELVGICLVKHGIVAEAFGCFQWCQ